MGTCPGLNPLSAYIAGTGETNVLDVDGQFYLSNWDGSDGVFQSNTDPGVRFFLHSPLLERIEAQTWRAEGPSDHGTLNGTNGPVAQRTKFLLPTSQTFGQASLTIANGVPVALDYLLDFFLSVPGDRPSDTFVVGWFGTAELFYQVQVATTLTPCRRVGRCAAGEP